MEKKLTVVNWLIKKLHTHQGSIDVLDVATINNYWEQAKQMEREQIEEAYNQGYREGENDAVVPTTKHDISIFSNASQYFTQTYQPTE